jgi:amino acid transporter
MSKAWLDGAAAPAPITEADEVRDPVSYKVKRALLGEPINRHDLGHQRLAKKFALGILASDCISSSAYGSEQILIALVPFLGLSAFGVLLPMTAVILGILVLLTLSYNNVISKYTSSGGAYIVARENLGTFWSIVAAVSLILDYIVTIAIQSAAGIVAVASFFPSVTPYVNLLTIAVIFLLTYGNLRGVKEAGKSFSLPTYLFVISMFVVFMLGIYQEFNGHLHQVPLQSGTMELGHHSGLLSIASVFILLRAFANGGSSLTGLEAISNGVSLFQSPEGKNARITMNIMSGLLGTLVFGVSWFASRLKVVPYTSGTPSVVSVIAKSILGGGLIGHIWFGFTQFATMLILIAGANTVYNAFPILAANISDDGFLPKQFARRGHKLVYSNGIIICSLFAVSLILFTGGSVNKLVALYALGVFTAFAITGYGMFINARKSKGMWWRAKATVSLLASITSIIVVIVFATVKFTEGAWLIVLVGPTLVFFMYRFSRQYKEEQAVLNLSDQQPATTSYARHDVSILIDSVDLSVTSAVRYALSLNPRKLEAVHFVVDNQKGDAIREKWESHRTLAAIPLTLIDCPDRRIPRAAMRYAKRKTADENIELTLLLPRRIYSPVLGRILHDQTAEQISAPISRLHNVVATIVPFNVAEILREQERPSDQMEHLAEPELNHGPSELAVVPMATSPILEFPFKHFEPSIRKIKDVAWRQRSHVFGQVLSISTNKSSSPYLDVEIWDETGGITLQFLGRSSIAGVAIGSYIKAEGMVGELEGRLTIMNPRYELMELPTHN